MKKLISKIRLRAPKQTSNSTISFWHQLRWNLILSFVLLAVLPVAIVVLITLNQTGEQARGQIIKQLESVAELKRDQITHWLEDSQSTLRLILATSASEEQLAAFTATPLSDEELIQNPFNDLFSTIVKETPPFKELFLYNAEGTVVASSDPVQIGKSVANRPYFADSLVREAIHTPYYEVGGGELALFVTRPLKQNGQTTGVLAGRLDTDVLGQIMLERTNRMGESGETYLVSPENNYLLTPSRFESEGYILTRAYHSYGIDQVLEGKSDSGTYGDYRSPPVTVIGVYRWLPELEVGLLAEIDEAEALASVTDVRNFSLILTAGAILLAVIVGLFTATRISKPITALTQVSTKIAKGDLSQRAKITRKNEIGSLATAFNQMADSLDQMVETERKANDAMKQAMETQVAKERIEAVVDHYLAFVEQVATGDLSTRLTFNGQDDNDDALVVLGHHLNKMVAGLANIIDQIRIASANISSAAAEVLAAATQQATGANEQSAAITQTSTTIDEVKTIAEQAFAKAQTVAEQAKQTDEVSQVGRQAVSNTIESMHEIKEKMEGIAENILALSTQTQQIGEITATVNDIASQSNLLALNAAVEAARADEHGKGFAVVALEVRNLAKQSKQAAAQVRAILNEIQQATNIAVMATEEGANQVDTGVNLTGQTGQTIQQLVANIADSAGAAQQIVASAQQQTTGMEQIAIAMENINQATLQNLAATRQAQESAQGLSSVARQLEATVAQYKLS